jgi:predicted membrane protein (TIGR00267 family)
MLSRIRRLREYLRIAGVASISRRYFVINSFDGAMTMLGILLGASATGPVDPKFVIGAGLGASFAMGVSGLSGAYLTEQAERARRLRGLKRAMLSDLRRSIHVKAASVASVWAALVDGFSPAIAAAVPMMPYALALFGIVPGWSAFPASILLILAILFILGAFLGKISRENMLAAGLRMLAVGICTAAVLMVLGSFGVR